MSSILKNSAAIVAVVLAAGCTEQTAPKSVVSTGQVPVEISKLSLLPGDPKAFDPAHGPSFNGNYWNVTLSGVNPDTLSSRSAIIAAKFKRSACGL